MKKLSLILFLLLALSVFSAQKSGIAKYDSLQYSKGKTVIYFDPEGNSVSKADAEYELTTYLPAQRTSMDFGGETRQTLVGQRFYGDELMYSGLSVEKIDTDFAGFLWVFERQD